MSTTVGILQPSYLPWLGYFEQMHDSDIFVFYDDVQFEKGSWRNRNRIKTAQKVAWLTVPVLKPTSSQSIRDVVINPEVPWARKHARTLEQAYARAPHYALLGPELNELLLGDWTMLCDLNLALIEWLCSKLGVKTRTVRSSQLGVPGQGQERLIRIVKELGGDTFYEGAAGRNYIDPEAFRGQGLNIRFQDYAHPVYDQLHGDFVSHLSVVDLLFNHGAESLGILTGNQP